MTQRNVRREAHTTERVTISPPAFISGATKAEAWAVWQAEIEKWVAMCEPGKIVCCSHCHGEGWLNADGTRIGEGY